jgi:hypothetical protein
VRSRATGLRTAPARHRYRRGRNTPYSTQVADIALWDAAPQRQSLMQLGHWLQVARRLLQADQQKARTDDGDRLINKDFAPVSREHSFR